MKRNPLEHAVQLELPHLYGYTTCVTHSQLGGLIPSTRRVGHWRLIPRGVIKLYQSRRGNQNFTMEIEQVALFVIHSKVFNSFLLSIYLYTQLWLFPTMSLGMSDVNEVNAPTTTNDVMLSCRHTFCVYILSIWNSLKERIYFYVLTKVCWLIVLLIVIVVYDAGRCCCLLPGTLIQWTRRHLCIFNALHIMGEYFIVDTKSYCLPLQDCDWLLDNWLARNGFWNSL